MNSRDFCVKNYEWKNKPNAVAAAQNTYAAFEKCSVNERNIRRWYANFETGDECLKNEDQDRPETVVDNDALCAIIARTKQYL